MAASLGPAAPGFLTVPITILLAEDDPTVREVIAAMLERLGYRVLPVACGPEALAVAKREKVDLLVADLGMPGMSGDELGRRFQEHYPDAPVVLISGGDPPSPTPAARFLRKPFTLADFGLALKRLLDFH